MNVEEENMNSNGSETRATGGSWEFIGNDSCGAPKIRVNNESNTTKVAIVSECVDICR